MRLVRWGAMLLALGLASPAWAADRCSDVPATASPLRRLTRAEFDATIADLLGDRGDHARSFPEEGGSGFDNNADLAVATRIHAQKYLGAAEAIAARAVRDLPRLLGCDPYGAGERRCVAAWIDGFGKRAWRRPLRAPERDALLASFDDQRRRQPLADAVRLVLERMLQSPRFLYRVEEGVAVPGTSSRRLTDHELATRLSYMLWGSLPDAPLFRAADAGRLHTPAQVAGHARRMLRDPRARLMVRRFHEAWLGVDLLDRLQKESDKFPAWKRDLGGVYKEQFFRFVDWAIWESDGSLETLLTTPVTFVNARLAALMKVDAPKSPETFERVTLDRKHAAGVLTLPGFLAMQAKVNETSPIKRGTFVREHLLCQIPPPPPANMQMNDLPAATADLVTVRERLEDHRLEVGCNKCHVMFDDLGLAFERWDAMGLWRDNEAGRPIDSSGTLVGSDVDGDFDDAVALAARLARSQQVRGCVARQWFRFAYGRTESAADACTLADLERRFAVSGHRIPELLVALTQTPAFYWRGPSLEVAEVAR